MTRCGPALIVFQIHATTARGCGTIAENFNLRAILFCLIMKTSMLVMSSNSSPNTYICMHIDTIFISSSHFNHSQFNKLKYILLTDFYELDFYPNNKKCISGQLLVITEILIWVHATCHLQKIRCAYVLSL